VQAVSAVEHAPGGFEQLCGVRLTEVTGERVLAELAVQDRLRDRSGAVHGGVYGALAESLATAGTLHGLGDSGGAVGLSNLTQTLRQVRDGTLHASAACRHAGRTTWVWEIEIRNGSGELCAFARTTLAVSSAAR
jgi:uncharacterized protein (TIGR00369 family)